MDEKGETPRQLFDAVKFTIFRRRIGQIALAVVLAEACIRYLNALVWYLIIPVISNVLATHTESVMFSRNRSFSWEPIAGSTVEFVIVIIFVFYANRWIYRLSQPSRWEVDMPTEADEEAVPLGE